MRSLPREDVIQHDYVTVQSPSLSRRLRLQQPEQWVRTLLRVFRPQTQALRNQERVTCGGSNAPSAALLPLVLSLGASSFGECLGARKERDGQTMRVTVRYLPELRPLVAI